MLQLLRAVIIALTFTALGCATDTPPAPTTAAANATSFAAFDQRARNGDALNVVFFGGSLTWGSNATDPNVTSYRALTGEHLRQKYPHARFKFIDAALGGTGSQVGVFRLEHDVLRHHPDLVFLDFSLNDGLDSPSEPALAAYESIIRRVLTDAHCPLQVVILAGKSHATRKNIYDIPGRTAHRKIADAYHVPIGDALALLHNEIQSGMVKADEVWPYDPIHPCDLGYAVYADAVWRAFEDAVKNRMQATVPAKMLHSDDYLTWSRARLSTLGPLPAGWSITKPNVQAAYYDGLMSRWLADEVRASNGLDFKKTNWGPDPDAPLVGTHQIAEPLELKFHGTSVLMFGERTVTSGKVRVLIDGQIVQFSTREKDIDYDATSKQWHNNQFLAEVLATGLATNVEHTLRIEPHFTDDVPQEFRLESICVAGPGAAVWR